MYTLTRPYLIPDWPCPSNVACCSSLRFGGHSNGDFDSFNLGMHVGDDPLVVSQNRQQLIHDQQLTQPPAWLNQRHSHRVTNLDRNTHDPNADASFTTTPERTCVVMTADCLPILICHRSGTEVAAIHAGWRGLLSGIISNTVNAMHSPPSELMAWLGPAIGPEAFALNTDIKQQFCSLSPNNKQAFKQVNDALLCNIYSLARNELRAKGIKAIFGGDYCTFSQTDHFFSYRRQNRTGRMATMITIKTI